MHLSGDFHFTYNGHIKPVSLRPKQQTLLLTRIYLLRNYNYVYII